MGRTGERARELLGRVPVLAARDLVYGDRFYEVTDKETRQLYARIVDALLELRSPRSVVDVGCGTGLMLERFAAHGVLVQGVEGSRSAIRRSSVGDRIHRANLERGVPTLGRFELCLCFELAEHLRASSAGPLVEGLARLSDVVVFTAAAPGQPGIAHVNLRPKEYWSDLFAANGLERSLLEHELLEAVADVPEPRYIHTNLMVFERTAAVVDGLADASSPYPPAS